jgi:hypothetical protein
MEPTLVSVDDAMLKLVAIINKAISDTKTLLRNVTIYYLSFVTKMFNFTE